MASSTAYMKRYPKFQNRKSLDLSALSSTQPLKKRPQNLSLKPVPLRAAQETFPKREPMNICETDSSMEYDKKGPAEIRPVPIFRISGTRVQTQNSQRLQHRRNSKT